MHNNNLNASLYGTKKIKVKRLIIQETGTYGQQYKRAFTSALDGHAVRSLLDTVEQTKTITASTIASIGLPLVMPSADTEGVVAIPNGWKQKRFKFFLELAIEDQMGSIKNEYIVGYTDYMGTSYSGALDNQMAFFVNAVNIVRVNTRITPIGTQTYSAIIDNSQVICNNNYDNAHAQAQMFVMRPDDIFTRIESSDLSQYGDNTTFVDTRLFASRKPMKNNRVNTSPTNFVASLLDSFRSANNADHSFNQTNVYQSAKDSLASSPIAQDPFISFIQSECEFGNSFNLSLLRSLDPEVDKVTVVVPMSHQARMGLHQADNSCDWGGSDVETLIASTLTQSVPAYMLESFLNDVNFRASNDGFGGKMVVVVSDANSFMQGSSLARYIEGFAFRVENELMKALSYNNQMLVDVWFKADLLDEVQIQVSVNGGMPKTFVAPAFADSLMTPNTTHNQANVATMTNHFDSLFSQIADMTGTEGNSLGNI